MFFAQISKLSPHSSDKSSSLKDLAFDTYASQVDHAELKWRCKHFHMINSSCRNKPDKSIGVVSMDYNIKMMIWGDANKFIWLGLDEIHDRTKLIELNFQKHLFSFG